MAEGSGNIFKRNEWLAWTNHCWWFASQSQQLLFRSITQNIWEHNIVTDISCHWLAFSPQLPGFSNDTMATTRNSSLPTPVAGPNLGPSHPPSWKTTICHNDEMVAGAKVLSLLPHALNVPEAHSCATWTGVCPGQMVNRWRKKAPNS